MASKQYEMLFKLGARLGENFKGTPPRRYLIKLRRRYRR